MYFFQNISVSQIQFKTIIFSENVYDEIQKLQRELCKGGKIYSISNTVNLLLKFCMYEENDIIFAQDHLFLRNYLNEKELFLKDFISSVFMSAH